MYSDVSDPIYYRDHLQRAPTTAHEAWRRKWWWGLIVVTPIATTFYLWWADLPLATGHQEPLTSVYPDSSLCPFIVFLLGAFAFYDALYLVATLAFRNPSHVSRQEKTIHFVLWTIIPPLFFFVEWFYLFPVYGLKTPVALEAFKQGQSITRGMWAGFVALFAASNIAEALKGRP